jgi:hypothetical protein
VNDHKLRCQTCKHRYRNPNDDDFCVILDDWLDGSQIDFIATVGCASHSDLVQSPLDCPFRVVDIIGVVDCKNIQTGHLPFNCSAKRYHNECPLGFQLVGDA